MTYLQLVNNILTRMRENTVSNVGETPYASLIGTLINDAKYEVEHAWDWSGLRTTIEVQVIAGTTNYTIANSSSTFKPLVVINKTDNKEMTQISDVEMTKKLTLTPVQTGTPTEYAYNGLDSATDDTKVDFYPIPDATNYIDFTGIARTPAMTTNLEVLSIPVQPVLLLAWAKAIEERGEDGGMASSMAYAYAQRALADAVSMDVSKHESETVWATV